jgi:hypothetical protein
MVRARSCRGELQVVFLGLGPRFRATGRGDLHCQQCGGDRRYRKCAGRRWLHLLFIPVVPLTRIPEHVQCTSCGTRYRTEVLQLPTVAQMQIALPAGTRAAFAAMLCAGDAGSLVARAHAIEAIREAGAPSYDEADLDADLARTRTGGDLAGTLRTLAIQMVMPAREWFLSGVVRIGLADGQLTHEERRAARQIAGYLGMTAAHAHGVIWMTEESAAGR